MLSSRKVRILVLSSDRAMRSIAKNTLKKENYSVATAGLPVIALKMLQDKEFDIIFFYLKIPNKQYLKAITEFKKTNPGILIMAILNTPSFDVIRQIFKAGVYDYLINPFNLEELLFLVNKATRFINLAFDNRMLLKELGESRARLEKHAANLEKEEGERVHTIDKLYKDLQDTYMRTIKTLIHAIDARDHYTHSHSKNVMRYAVAIAKELKLNQKEIEEIREACALHDLGKIAIQDSILTKPGKLTKKEWAIIKQHSLKGVEILSPLGFLDGVIDLVRQHHERYDGNGYPDGVRAEKIFLGSRIMSVADSYDAMISARPYKKRPFTKSEAIAELKANSGTQFDPNVVKAFLRIIKRF